MLTKQEVLLERAPGGEQEVREPRRTAPPRGSQSWLLW